MNENSNSSDCLVIGAGIFGLWQARHAILRGESVLVLDKARAGAGASGGFLGALMPHMPDRWNAKKQFQFEALDGLAEAVALLEADTGLDCGYRRCGRLMPLTHAKMPDHAKARIEGSKTHWQGKYEMRRVHLEALPVHGWLSEEVAPYGAVYDTLSARLNPRAYIAALAQYVRKKGEIREASEVVLLDPTNVSVTLRDGSVISAGRIVIANGYEAYPLLAGIDARIAGQAITGRGVKGQAVLLEFAHDDTLPIVYDNGSYIVPHAGNRVAIGSTSLDEWDNVSSFDPDDMAFYEHALELVPALRDAPIIERWASVRPRNTMLDASTGKVGTEPVWGVLEGCPRISMAIGGFKIGLGVGNTSMN